MYGLRYRSTLIVLRILAYFVVIMDIAYIVGAIWSAIYDKIYVKAYRSAKRDIEND